MAITVTVTPPNETSITVGSGNAITVDIVQGTNRVVTATTSTPTAVTYRSLVSGGTGVTYSGSDGVINIGQDVATTATPSFAAMTIDSIIINGTTIGHTSDTDLLTFASNQLTVAGEIEATALDINGNGDVSGTLTAGTFSGSLPTSDLTGTITNAQLAGSIANDKLANSTVSFGGISLALGASDATPAFDLSDATNYPTSSLSGTITNAQLAGSIANDKLANTSVSLGGVSVTLGSSDATPAFDLADATNYPTTSLSGTITNDQLAGSIANSKLSNSSVSFGGVSVTLGASDATPAFNLSDATNIPAGQLTGTIADGIQAVTQSASDNSTKVATTAYTDTAIANLVDSSPGALNTLNELAAAINDDASFSTTITNSIATKLPLAGGEMTGNITFSSTQTVDGRDLSVDGAKLDNIEASADVTDTANVTAAGALMDSEVTNLAQVKAFDSSDYAPAAGSSNIVTTGALNSGSITSGFTSIDIGSGALTAGATTINGNFIVNNDFAEIVSTDAGATEMPILALTRNSASPATNDKLGAIRWFGEADSGEKKFFGEIYTKATDIGDASEQGQLVFTVAADNGLEGAASPNAVTDVTADLTNDLDPAMTLDQNGLTIPGTSNFTIDGYDNGGGIVFKESDGSLGTITFTSSLSANRTATFPDKSGTVAFITDLTNFITASSSNTLTNKSIDAGQLTGTIDDARIPSGIARDSELSSFITASSTDTLTNKSISGEQITSGTVAAARVATLNQDTTGTASKVVVSDSTANTNFPITFHDESNSLLDDTGTFTYNPSTGTASATNFSGNLTGTLQTAAQTNITSVGTLSGLTTGATTINGTLNVNSDSMEITSTTDNAHDMPILSLYRNAGAGATNDEIGGIRFFGQNESDQKCFYAGIYTEMRGINNGGGHKGSLRFHVADGNGAGVNISDVTADIAGDEDPTMTLTSSLITVKNPLFIDEDTDSLQIADSSGSLTSNISSRIASNNQEQANASKLDSRVHLPDCQGSGTPATLHAGFLFGNNIDSDKTSMTQAEVCSMRGGGLFIYNDADGITVDLPASNFNASATILKPGDELKFVSFLGTITFDTDASGTQQTIYKIGNTTNGTAAISALTSGNFTLPAGGYMTLRAAWNNIYIIVEHCGVAGI